MTTDEKVELAERIAKALQGVKHNEWERWARYAHRKGLGQALQLAKYMGGSQSLRYNPKRAAGTIYSVINNYQKLLNSLPGGEVAEVLGYVGRWLVALNPGEE